MLFVVNYMCTREDVEIAPRKRVMVNIDIAGLDRNDMECMFQDNMQLDGEVSTWVCFKLLIIKPSYMIYLLYSFIIHVLSAYIHCIRDEEHLLHKKGGKVLLENAFICCLLKRDGDPEVTLSNETETIDKKVDNYFQADTMKLKPIIYNINVFELFLYNGDILMVNI